MGSIPLFNIHNIMFLIIFSTLIIYAQSKTFDLSLNNTWRCGVFVSEPGEKFSDPLVKYFVIQNFGLTTCPPSFKETYKKGTFSKKCAEMGQSWEKLWSGGLRKESGEKYGDEVCSILESELDMTDVPNDVFPEGIQFGYYYNYCENEDWKDTGKRSEVSVCCEGGKYKSCEEIFEEEYADEYSESENSIDGSNGAGSSGGGSDAIAATMAKSERINDLKSKLESGEPLSDEEVEELRQYIAGLRATAEFLLQSAAELEELLEQSV